MGVHFWKSLVLARSSFQYLHLDGAYTVGTKAKKKQQVLLKNGRISNSFILDIQVAGRNFMEELRIIGVSGGVLNLCLL